MKWEEIKKQYPDKFILLGNLVEEEIAKDKFRIIEGTILKVSDNAKEIQKAYQEYNRNGESVLYSIPSTPNDFIVENVYARGYRR